MNDGLPVVVAEQPGAAFVTYRKKWPATGRGEKNHELRVRQDG
jgi:hypothetical protein